MKYIQKNLGREILILIFPRLNQVQLNEEMEVDRIEYWAVKCRLPKSLQVTTGQIIQISKDLPDKETEKEIKEDNPNFNGVKREKRNGTPIKTVEIKFDGDLQSYVCFTMQKFPVSPCIDKV